MELLNLLDIIECDFYSIEMEDGVKQLPMNGYFYLSPDDKEHPYQYAEMSWCYVKVSDMVAAEDKQELVDMIAAECKQYIDGLTETEAQSVVNGYCYGNPPERLKYSDITEDTPCGYYVNY